MRYLLITLLLFSGFTFAADPIQDVDVILLEIPPCDPPCRGLAEADTINVKGLPPGSDIIGLPSGWRVVGQRGDTAILQGPPTGDKISIKFTSPDPNWKVSMIGYKGRENIWNSGLRTRASKGVSVMTAGRAIDGPVHMDERTVSGEPQAANSYHSSRSNRKKPRGEIATPDSPSGVINDDDMPRELYPLGQETYQVSPNAKGACCLPNGKCGNSITKSNCDRWKGTLHLNESCPAACQ